MKDRSCHLVFDQLHNQDLVVVVVGGGGGGGCRAVVGPSTMHVPVQASEWELLVMQWYDNLYVDTCVPFGLHFAPSIFDNFASAHPLGAGAQPCSYPPALPGQLCPA